MSDDATLPQISEINLRTLKLQPGTMLQIQHASDGATLSEAQFIAALPGKGVMTAPHDSELEMEVGEEYHIRGFTGQYDFLFSSRVLQNFTAPFPYALLAYPEHVKARLVRKAMRMKTLLPATVSSQEHKTPLPVTLIDLSAAGAMINAPQTMGSTGKQLDLRFSVEIDNHKIDLKLLAQIAHSAETTDGCRVGLMFKGLAPNDKMALQCFVMSLAQ